MGGNEIGHVAAARLVWWRSNDTQLTGRAFNFDVPDCQGEQGLHHVGERIQVVKPIAPENVERVVRHKNTAEVNENRTKNKGVD